MDKLNSVEVWMSDRQVGRLAFSLKSGCCAFEYSAEWLQTGFSISPFELPLRNEVFLAKPSPFYGGFGVFADSLPDGWGMLILDRYLKSKGIIPSELNIPQRLSLVGSNGRGALEFRPDRSITDPISLNNFETLAKEADAILKSDEYQGDGIEEFQFRGGSPGGARPKIFTNYNGKEWLVKFRATSDPINIGKLEYNYSKLAKKCGVEMPETHLFENKYFGVERFDRTHKGKVHVVSVAGVIGADYRLPSIDYLHIFKVCSILTHNVAELWKIFRLMTFNYLIDNKDDHAKNFAFINIDGEWRFAPAFDLLPGGGINGYRTTSINDNILPSASDLFAVAYKAGLDVNQAKTIYQEMKDIIK